ncbi:hypothetical protein FQZ97_830100 [compost metagenome]
MHISPWLLKMPMAAACAARSRSGQSSNTMCGDLPPHSSQTRFRLDWPEYSMKRLPVAVEPVKAMQSTSGCSPSACPACAPSPGTTLKTPAGMPASAASSASRSAVNGDCSAGLRMTLLPAASAGATFQLPISSG